ncbi:hypothetical protein HMPREF0063_13066 [Aeromicrobium marinum DSM 15272]|uniref:Mce-associated membrane protein n=1 Tax=Aeromicrobium marinum DSM 15272 TaxID=585531 RepID=E2SGA7_9ACTN|nr:hypothetical protein [Aeromicrobium marinum]EFQ81864.1 hypothetical protein HMPREF0063_13066 [Aeromicrobium marinum DSM 15272]
MAADRTDEVDDDSGPPGSGRLRIAVPIAVGVVAGVAGLVMFVVSTLGSGTEASSDAKTVVARATDFAVAYSTYDADDLEDYQDRVSSLLTEESREEFLASTQADPTLGVSQLQASEAEVRGAGVDSIDGDSASVLVAVDATVTIADSPPGIVYTRWIANLVKVDGRWMVEQFLPVPALDATATTPGETPAPAPDEVAP